MDNEELKECPFCGDKPGILEGYSVWFVICVDDVHRAGTCCKTKQEAIKAWNTRHNKE